MRGIRIAFAALMVAAAVTACDEADPGGNISVEPLPPLNASETLTGFITFGLPVVDVVVLTPETDENKLMGRPHQYTSKANFIDRRYPGDSEAEPVNTVEVFSTEEDAAARQAYIEKVTQGKPFLTQYIYRKGLIVLRLDRTLCPEHAKEYERGLDRLVS